MRFRVKISFSYPLYLPIQYNHILQAFIYDSIPDENFRRWLHQRGMTLGKRTFKMFTFSRLFGKFEINKKEGKICFFDQVTFYVSSAVEEVIQELGNGFLSRRLQFLEQPVQVEEIQVMPEPDIEESAKINMLSPVVVYRTEIKDRKKYTKYYNPEEKDFKELLRDNLYRKYKTMFNKEPQECHFDVVPLTKLNPKNFKIMKYKGTVIKGWMGRYEIKASPELLRLAYDSGLGTKNAQGFGCFEIL